MEWTAAAMGGAPSARNNRHGGAAPQQAYAAPQPQAIRSRKDDGGKGLFIGCGAAGCLGVLIISAIIYAVIKHRQRLVGDRG